MNTKEWNTLLERVARQIYEGRLKPDSISPAMVRTTAEELMAGIQRGYGKSFADEGLSSTHIDTLLALQQNVYHFSGAKNWNQLREMTALMMGDDGQLKPFNKFLNDVRMIDTTYNKVYLKTEYEHAVTSAQMINKWQQFEAEKKALPYLVWRIEISDRVCKVCEPLNGLKLRVDHPFWKANGVPRHFNCHCDIEQDDTGPEETKEEIKKRGIPPPQPMFNSNPGITGVAYSTKHPYFVTIPAAILKKIIEQSENAIKFDQERLRILLLDRAKQFEKVKVKGGYVLRHKLVKTDDSDYNTVFSEAKKHASKSSMVEILPKIETHELSFFYKRVYPNNEFIHKMPDLRINFEYTEVEESKTGTANSIDQRVREGARQAKNVVLYLPVKMNWKKIVRLAAKRLNNTSAISVTIVGDGRRTTIKKPNQ